MQSWRPPMSSNKVEVPANQWPQVRASVGITQTTAMDVVTHANAQILHYGLSKIFPDVDLSAVRSLNMVIQ